MSDGRHGSMAFLFGLTFAHSSARIAANLCRFADAVRRVPLGRGAGARGSNRMPQEYCLVCNRRRQAVERAEPSDTRKDAIEA